MRSAYNGYRGRVPRREEAFDNPGTREGHSLRSVEEFYAEGYNVFHGPHRCPQSRLFRYAAELYAVLEREALAEQLSIPPRSELARACTR